jgi:hypothetical protein
VYPAGPDPRMMTWACFGLESAAAMAEGSGSGFE